MKKRRVFLTDFITLLCALCLLFPLCTLTAYAAPGDELYTQEEGIAGNPDDSAYYNEYLGDYQYVDDPVYVEPENLQDLPQANEGEVQPATAVTIPEGAVSEATLFSGIVMWLCVALGIAVLVGVLVSKRTLRRGL